MEMGNIEMGNRLVVARGQGQSWRRERGLAREGDPGGDGNGLCLGCISGWDVVL